jgi:monoamine oxidase
MDVVVVGAGAAGLAAAQAVSAGGLEVCILEARNRIGGRVHTLRDRRIEMPIELGAEFVHGRPPEIFSIARAANLSMAEVSGPHRYARGGRFVGNESLFSKVDQIFARMSEPSLPDQTFAQFLAGSEADSEAQSLAKAYVEGFNAARADRISVRALAGEMRAADAIDGDHSFRVKDGYDRIVDWLWRECKLPSSALRLETVTTTVRWRRGRVEVEAQTPSGAWTEPVAASCAVITLPIGVLKASEGAPGAIRFVPALGQSRSALKRLEMGQAVRITLAFRRSFWNQHRQLSRTGFIHSDEKCFPTWWTTLAPRAPALTGWTGGAKAESIVGLTDAALADCAIDSLAHILGMARQAVQDEVESYWLHNWCADAFSRGAYSYACVGGMEARLELATPVENTLFFAGEATETEGHGGTVHGAIATGKRAAQAILQRL